MSELSALLDFAEESRSEAIKDMQKVLSYLDDADMKKLTNKVIGKL